MYLCNSWKSNLANIGLRVQLFEINVSVKRRWFEILLLLFGNLSYLQKSKLKPNSNIVVQQKSTEAEWSYLIREKIGKQGNV